MSKTKVYREAFRINDEDFDGDVHGLMDQMMSASHNSSYEVLWDVRRMQYVVVERCYEN